MCNNYKRQQTLWIERCTIYYLVTFSNIYLNKHQSILLTLHIRFIGIVAIDKILSMRQYSL